MTTPSGYPPRRRHCSQALCNDAAAATLALRYSAREAVIAPLAEDHVPGDYDLCAGHARSMTFPKGWQVTRRDLDDLPGPATVQVVAPVAPAPMLSPVLDPAPAPAPRTRRTTTRAQAPEPQPQAAKPARRRHLRIVPGKD
jgi:hypothetical protein